MSSLEGKFLWRLARRCQLGFCLRKEQDVEKDETACKVGTLNVSLGVTFEMVGTVFRRPGAVFGPRRGGSLGVSVFYFSPDPKFELQNFQSQVVVQKSGKLKLHSEQNDH